MLRLVFIALGKTDAADRLSQVLGDKEFAEDPCALNHVCLPMVEVVNQESTK